MPLPKEMAYCHPNATLDRYVHIFKPFPDSVLAAHQWDCPDKDSVAFVVEAPLNSVEVLEAVLQPEAPFEIYKVKVLPQPDFDLAWHNPGRSKIIQEYAGGQGLLHQEGREISIVCVPRNSLPKLEMRRLLPDFLLVTMHFLPIVWPEGHWGVCGPAGSAGVSYPYGLVHTGRLNKERPQDRYSTCLLRLEEELHLYGCGYERSLVEPGTKALPETVMQYITGSFGTEACRPYYKVEKVGKEEEETVTVVEVEFDEMDWQWESAHMIVT